MQALDLILDLPLTGELSADPAEILRRMVDRWLPDFFRPMECRAVVGGERFDRAPGPDAAPWPGETIGGGPVSRLQGPAAFTAEDLGTLPTGDRYAVRLIGALRFVEPAVSPEPDWYGRVVWSDAPGEAPSLVTLAYVQFHWNENWREIRLSFPALGYPISGQLTQIDKEGLPVGTQADALVDRNRRLVIEAFARGAEAIGFQPPEVSWSVEAEADTPVTTREAITALLKSAAGRP